MPVYDLHHLRDGNVVATEKLRATSLDKAEAAALLRLRSGGQVAILDQDGERLRLPRP